jgi:hypothetical protein
VAVVKGTVCSNRSHTHALRIPLLLARAKSRIAQIQERRRPMSRPAAAKPKSSLARARSVRRLHALPKYWLTKVELEQQRRGKFSVQVYIATVPGTHTRGPPRPPACTAALK